MAPSFSSKDKKVKSKGMLSSLFSSSPGTRAENSNGESTTSKKSKKPHGSQHPSSSQQISSFSRTKAPVSEMMPSEAFKDASRVTRSELMASENFRDKSKAKSRRPEPQKLASEKPWSPKTTMINIAEVEEVINKHTASSTRPSMQSRMQSAIESAKYEDFEDTYAEPSAKPSQSSRMESVNFEDFRSIYIQPSQKAPKIASISESQLAESFQSKYSLPTGPLKYPIATSSRFASVSMAPPNVSSMFIDEKDQKMASRQLQIENLAPRDRAEQEEWAQDMISKIGNCPQDFAWRRLERDHGYQCDGGGHFVSDELLAEGKGGLYLNLDGSREGPYYADPATRRQFLYAGPVPKSNWFIPDGWRMNPFLKKDMPFYKRKDGSTFNCFVVGSKMEWEEEVNKTEQEANASWNALLRNARR